MSLRIGKLAERTGSSVRSLRHYESQGLLRSTRTSGGHRVFDDDAVDRVVYLQHLYRAGLSSRAILEVIPCLDTPSVLSSEAAFDRLVQERDKLRAHRNQLTRTLSALNDLIAYNRAHRPSQDA
ncbi:MerR family transcriptional regulator [Streptomyces chartreusis]|uniref:MerR family transcriptional regulator n=1 Tax=Streptomyces chartreusis TaxID=1969 RepID=UPI0036878C0B